MKKVRGFTLIELLVVIAIIAILAAILFPVFASARAKARQTQCASNLKQLGLAVIQYAQDYDEYFPMAWSGSAWQNVGTPGSYNQGTYSIIDMLQPYIKSYAVWHCPSEGVNGGAEVVHDPTRPSDYGYNYCVLGGDFRNGASGTSGIGGSALLSQIQSPANLIEFADMMWAAADNPYRWVAWNNGDTNLNAWYNNNHAWGNPNLPIMCFANGGPDGPANNWSVGTGPSAWCYNGQPAVDRHSGVFNCLYTDGHVKSRNPAQVMNHTLGAGDQTCEWCNGI